MNIFKSRAGAVVAGAAVVVALGSTGAVARGLIGTDDIRNGGVTKADIATDAVGGGEIVDGSVNFDDLRGGVKNALAGKASQADVDALTKRLTDLEARVSVIEDELDGGLEQAWVGNDASKVENGTAVAVLAADDNDGTSVETTNLDEYVKDGGTVSFKYALGEGTACTAGAPRMFVVVGDTLTNSWDQLEPAGTQCGENGVVTYKVAEGGRISAAGFVYDNVANPGTVTFSDLTIDGKAVAIK